MIGGIQNGKTGRRWWRTPWRKLLSSNTIDENVVYDQAQKFYSQNFRDENHALLYYAYLEDNETDCAYLVIGDEAIKIFDNDMQDEFWDVYDRYYYGDATEAEWLSYTFSDMGAVKIGRAHV